MQNFEQALANNAKGIEPYKKDAMRDLAVSHMKMKEFEKAEDIIVKMSTKTNEDKAIVSYLKGQLSTATVQLEKAESFFKKLLCKIQRIRYIQLNFQIYMCFGIKQT